MQQEVTDTYNVETCFLSVINERYEAQGWHSTPLCQGLKLLPFSVQGLHVMIQDDCPSSSWCSIISTEEEAG